MRKQTTQEPKRATTPVRTSLAHALALRMVASLAAATALTATTTQVYAQAAATGTVTGRVQNATNGQYLNNARITVEGTNLEAFTDEFGEFQLNDVPVGTTKLKVFYTGLDPKEVNVNVASGEILSKEISLTSSQLTSGTGEGDMIVLDAFTVSNQREFNAGILAANEQRFAPNIKNVVSADAFGDVTEGNVGEFVKYLPGITVDYVAADVRTISVRGFAAGFTNMYQDGLRLVSASSGNLNRVFELEQVSINNAARIEVAKVPTPDVGADALGGSINMITKNAFERPSASFKYKAYLSFNHEDIDFKKTPGPGNKNSFKMLPGFEFDYTLPVNKKFGLIITGLSSNQFNEQHRSQPTWNFNQVFVPANATATPPTAAIEATDANPFLQTYQIQDGPKNTFRDSVSIKADWKVAPGHVLSANLQANYYKSFFGNRNLNFNVNTTGTPSVATGTPISWGQTFVQSASGRGTVTQGSSFRDKLGATQGIFLNYAYTGRDWEWTAATNYVKSRTWYRDQTRNHFNGVNTTLQGVSVVRMEDIGYPRPNVMKVTSATGAVIDPYNIANYRINSVTSGPVDGEASVRTLNFSLKRKLDIMGVPSAIKIGADIREEVRDNRRWNDTFNFVGADGVANTADDAAQPYLDHKYSSEDPYWNFNPIQWASPYKLYEISKSNPNYFQAAVGGGANERNRILNSERIKETVSAGYAQVETRLLKNRLRIVTGVRYEKTKDSGEGALSTPDAVFQRNANGTYVDGNLATPAIERVRRTDAGLANSMEEVRLTTKERAFLSNKSYDDLYPSLHTTFNITDDLIFRFAYARTLGRPDYGIILPRSTYDENDLITGTGTVTTNNTGLKPWTGDAYDLALEYYLPKGGLISAGVFRKDLNDFWGRLSGTITPEIATDLNLPPEVIGWTIASMVNVGKAKISGAEFNYDQPLTFLPGIGRHFKLTANGTILHLQGANNADFTGFIPKSGNLGISFSRKPVVVLVKWNYRGRQRNTQQTGAQYRANTWEYYDSRYTLDANFEYTLSKRYTLFANGRNILNQSQDLERYSPTSADYAHQFRTEEFGIQWAVGVKGTF